MQAIMSGYITHKDHVVVASHKELNAMLAKERLPSAVVNVGYSHA